MPVEGRCSNHFEIAFTESEFLLDFGQAYGEPADALIHTRIIMTPRSAKTFLTMFTEMVEKYDQATSRDVERSV